MNMITNGRDKFLRKPMAYGPAQTKNLFVFETPKLNSRISQQ